MSKRLVGRIFISRFQENANRSERFSEKALDRTAELALRDGHCAFAGKSA